MSQRTVQWTTDQPEGLRERKKRETRQKLSDTATEMFVEHGFDAVRVADVAKACGVSEKTVFNYFPTKESLVLDRWDSTSDSLRTGLADAAVPVVEAAERILAGELNGVTSWLESQTDATRSIERFLKFGALVRSTPSLRAHQHNATEALVDVAAEALASRLGGDAEDPEPRVAARALLGLWDVQFRSLRKHLEGAREVSRVRDAVTADVARAARLLEAGLGTFAVQ